MEAKQYHIFNELFGQKVVAWNDESSRNPCAWLDEHPGLG